MSNHKIPYLAGAVELLAKFSCKEHLPLKVVLSCPAKKLPLLQDIRETVGVGSLYKFMSGGGPVKKVYYRLVIQSYADVGKFIEFFAGRFQYHRTCTEFEDFVDVFRERQRHRAQKTGVAPTAEAESSAGKLTFDKVSGRMEEEDYMKLRRRFPNHAPTTLRSMLEGAIPIPPEDSEVCPKDKNASVNYPNMPPSNY